jgi:hypothetical protein
MYGISLRNAIELLISLLCQMIAIAHNYWLTATVAVFITLLGP